jgi:hypothetical protein
MHAHQSARLSVTVQVSLVIAKLRTFARNISTDNAPVTQSDLRRLPLSRVGLFRLCDADFETDAFHLRAADHGWTERAALLLRFAAAIADLIEGSGTGWGGRE